MVVGKKTVAAAAPCRSNKTSSVGQSGVTKREKRAEGAADKSGAPAGPAAKAKKKATRAPRKAAARRATAPEVDAATDPLVGKKPPSFELPDQSARSVRSASLSGQAYVLFFYPKDSTPGCTTEALAFEGLRTQLSKLGIVLLGCSPDSVASHARFASKQGLGFPLLSDTERQLCSAYGVWAEKRNYGRTYMGVVRSTFLINAAGRVARVWRGVRVKGHAEAVLEAARELMAP